ncbi:hypothetical protein FQN52_000854 [Onygenales sp. PD_12]|nr:hypothetical protein FQN52_000854 [Onygenales sp. PD_12]
MFSTFEGRSMPPSTDGQSENSSSSRSVLARPKRHQVARACDWCRRHRIKCDNDRPCHNCRSRNGKCSTNGKAEVQTLPHALREIERLRMRIKQLEQKVENDDRFSCNGRTSLPNGRLDSSTELPLTGIDVHNQHRPRRRYWEGIHTSTAKSQQTQLYGPASPFYFIGRMSSYLAAALQQPHPDRHFQPNSACRSFASPMSSKNGTLEENPSTTDIPFASEYLTGTQEDYFLNLFWQSHHCTLQILDESEFREHYKSLWESGSKARKPSALVDIVLAICMQYGVAFPRSDVNSISKADVDSNDATIAGRWFYRRSEALLASELESPSITTLQCQVLIVIYLCNASFQNIAHSALALAVRTAHILGLHLEPPEDIPLVQRELRKRLWWTLYAIESKTCMKLGRPFSVHLYQTTVSLPADDQDLALRSGSNFGSFGEGITWLTFGGQNTRLLLASRTIYTAFYDKCADILTENGGKSMYEDLQGLETCAEFLTSSMGSLATWLSNVPDALKMKRKNMGSPFSTDRSPLEVERFTPSWLKRQQLVLELLYHNLSMNFYRPFICFGPETRPYMEANAALCVSHAMAITHIMHQILDETDLLDGWHETYQWQWNATLSMIGFILAYPTSPSMPVAREAINSAISVFENFGNNFAIAASAANVTRDLTAKADFLINRLQNGHCQSTPYFPGNADVTQLNGSNNPTSDESIGNQDFTAQLNDQNLQNAISGSLGLAFTVDSFNSFEPLWGASSDMSDYWSFTQD